MKRGSYEKKYITCSTSGAMVGTMHALYCREHYNGSDTIVGRCAQNSHQTIVRGGMCG
jgi:hypothetical protein